MVKAVISMKFRSGPFDAKGAGEEYRKDLFNFTSPEYHLDLTLVNGRELRKPVKKAIVRSMNWKPKIVTIPVIEIGGMASERRSS